ncbi:C40 family peptidase [Emticicia sp. BO119]|uniref:C40 family peptidase n=1 Tax=Emticicia sp. BO119 TaxID=2757768 RepID=UPI0015F02180|nr:C40 family peptidase [Emticicia sp. BO119]MBA4854090.1 C40 family peptidase [Emticicia sp. BO119]
MLKKYVLGSLLVVTSMVSKATDLPKSLTTSPNEVSDKNNSKLTDDLQRFARKLIGIRYLWSGKTLKGFDCSGLVNYVFAKFGMKLSHRSIDLFKLGYQTTPEEAQPGDLIFFKINANRKDEVSHVGIVLESDKNGLKFIHSACKTGVSISYLKEKYYASRFAGIRRVIDSLTDSK